MLAVTSHGLDLVWVSLVSMAVVLLAEIASQLPRFILSSEAFSSNHLKNLASTFQWFPLKCNICITAPCLFIHPANITEHPLHVLHCSKQSGSIKNKLARFFLLMEFTLKTVETDYKLSYLVY